MSDKPILFSAPMVRALIDGRKTQTRRVLNHHVDGMFVDRVGPTGWQFTGEGGVPRIPIQLKYAVGDRLYVREAWKTHAAYDDLSPAALGGDEPIEYQADGAYQTWGYPAISKIGRFRQGMHMPRWASRVTLIITDVRLQRLQECTREDAIAEGLVRIPHAPPTAKEMGCNWGVDGDTRYGSPVSAYAALWNSLNAARGYGWDTNPWVAAYTFRPILGNIDQIGGEV